MKPESPSREAPFSLSSQPLAATDSKSSAGPPASLPATAKLRRYLPELDEIERTLERLAPYAHIETLARIPCDGHSLPLYAASLGPRDPKTPVLGIFGGVHGLEKIGTHLASSFLATMAQLASWDPQFADFLTKVRLVCVPLVNPGGMYLRRRANPRGVDLMRNAPVEAEHLAPFRLLSGHRLSPRLPWYRGAQGEGLEAEAEAVVNLARQAFFPARCVITLDIHSGFGVRDRLWFPYAKSKTPFPHLAQMYALVDLFEETYPHNVYKIEPQSKSYTTHGDLWDFIYDQYCAQPESGTYLPLCLELGSWIWVKKNPLQLFNPLGAFNPMVLHRHQRTMRRHLVLFDFLRHAVLAADVWAFPTGKARSRLIAAAHDEWYPAVEV